jgi:hypothetical protein
LSEQLAERPVAVAQQHRGPLLAEAQAGDDVELAIAVEVAHTEGISGGATARHVGEAAGDGEGLRERSIALSGG